MKNKHVAWFLVAIWVLILPFAVHGAYVGLCEVEAEHRSIPTTPHNHTQLFELIGELNERIEHIEAQDPALRRKGYIERMEVER